MPWYVKCTRLLVALATVVGCAAAPFYGQISDAQVQQPYDQSAQPSEAWPGQIRAYKAFSEMLSAEDSGARQNPDRAKDHRTDFNEILGLTDDEVGDLWATMLSADHDCDELDSAFYTQYPRIPPMQALENAKNGPELSSVDIAAATAKKRQAFTDLNEKKEIVIHNAIDELKNQLGTEDFLGLDGWVHNHFAQTKPFHHHPAQRR